MPMRFWAEALCAVALPMTLGVGGCASAQPASDAGPSASARRVIQVPAGSGRTMAVPVALDPALIAPGGRHAVTAVGAPRGGYLLVIDSYASRPQGLSRCRAGQERWARLIDLRARREIYHRLVESCLTNVAPNDPPVRWDGDGRGVVLDLLSPAPVHARIDANGRVTEE